MTISYVAGIAGGLAVLFSLDTNNVLQGMIFWFHIIIIYFVALIILFIITSIFRSHKKKIN